MKTHGDAPRGHATAPPPIPRKPAGPTMRGRVADSRDEDPTSIYGSGTYPNTPAASQPRPGEPDFVREAATPIKVKSMKTPGQASSGAIPVPNDARPMPQVKLRAISEVASKGHAHQQQLGYLAPPRDPQEVRARRQRDFIVWGSICVILACVVALGIWFLAK
jgi:hypothetical protein